MSVFVSLANNLVFRLDSLLDYDNPSKVTEKLLLLRHSKDSKHEAISVFNCGAFQVSSQDRIKESKKLTAFRCTGYFSKFCSKAQRNPDLQFEKKLTACNSKSFQYLYMNLSVADAS